ncbi:MAG: YndJ family protein [Burkholderiales bacterium]|nr:YndJ family protein [Anaerolineae bacterium]
MVKINVTKLPLITAITGGVLWLLAIYLHPNTFEMVLTTQAEMLFLFGIWVLAPLALKLVVQLDRKNKADKLYLTTLLTQITSLNAAAFLFSPLGFLGWVISFHSLWAIMLMITALLVAFIGLSRLLLRSWTPIEELSIDIGLMYSLVGGAWFVAWIQFIRPLGYNDLTVVLTANHFTFIGFGALIITGMVGRQLNQSVNRERLWRWYRLTASGVILAPMLVEFGIAFSRTVEIIGVVILAVSLLSLAVLTLAFVVRTVSNVLAKILIALSASCLFLTMTFALAYGIGRYTGWWQVSLDTMVTFHGWVNALGFSFLGIVGWLIAAPQARTAAPGIPFSRLRGRGTIGPQFFERIGAIDTAKVKPMGIVDNLSDYARDDFNPEQTCPQVRAFYEHTAQHRLEVTPVWGIRFRFGARLYKRISSALSQMNFPLEGEDSETLIHSEIVPLSDALDGRQNVRGWVRVYEQTGKAVYVAAYANHQYAGHTYMNIAFPLPFSNLTSILRIEALTTDSANNGVNNGVALTSLTTPQTIGDQGVYFVTRWLSLRLPINEIIRVYPAGCLPEDAPATFHASPERVFARHDMWLLGIKFLTLYYAIAEAIH